MLYIEYGCAEPDLYQCFSSSLSTSQKLTNCIFQISQYDYDYIFIIDKSSGTIMLYYSERPQLIAILSAATQKLSTQNTSLRETTLGMSKQIGN